MLRSSFAHGAGHFVAVSVFFFKRMFEVVHPASHGERNCGQIVEVPVPQDALQFVARCVVVPVPRIWKGNVKEVVLFQLRMGNFLKGFVNRSCERPFRIW